MNPNAEVGLLLTARSADWQSAVSQVGNLRGRALILARKEKATFADYQSAIQQVNNLRYGDATAWQQTGRKRLKGEPIWRNLPSAAIGELHCEPGVSPKVEPLSL